MIRSLTACSRCTTIALALSLSSSCTPADDRSSRAGTPELRAALFDTIMALTAAREAFSPFKNEHWGTDPLQSMAAYRDELIAADSEGALFYALEKVSNARNDRHLDVALVPGGLRLAESAGLEVVGGEVEPVYVAPVRILPDYSDPSVYFVADVSEDHTHFPDGGAEPGDRVISVNGRPMAEYEAAVRPYQASSYRPNLRWRMAEDITARSAIMPPSFYREGLELELEGADGAVTSVTLPYLHPDSIPWANISEPHYPGFRLEHATPTYDLYLPEDGGSVLILTWYGFRETMIADVDELMELAVERGWLDHDLIIDGTRSRGGSAGAYAVQRFTPKPFKTTFGNLRISDVVPLFTEEKRREIAGGGSMDSGVPEAMDDGSWLMEWLDTDVADSIAAGAEYTNNVPFKLAHAPKDSDGILHPAAVHFRGRLVAFFVPRRGSHLDQFASIIKDNDLGPMIGMTPGGYSNTWEWDEVLYFPGTDQPVVRFMWDVGHSIRPNGEILEGNPAHPDELVLLTRENFRTYYAELLRRALAHLGA
jgi:hypothetical protein